LPRLLADSASNLHDDPEQRADAGEHHQACDENVGFHGCIVAAGGLRDQRVNPRIERRKTAPLQSE
jgi:hypothetical protein